MLTDSLLVLHRLALTCIFLANKYLEDMHLPLRFTARIGGVSPSALLRLEEKALELLDWRLEVPASVFEGTCRSVGITEEQPINDELKQEAANSEGQSSTSPNSR